MIPCIIQSKKTLLKSSDKDIYFISCNINHNHVQYNELWSNCKLPRMSFFSMSSHVYICLSMPELVWTCLDLLGLVCYSCHISFGFFLTLTTYCFLARLGWLLFQIFVRMKRFAQSFPRSKSSPFCKKRILDMQNFLV